MIRYEGMNITIIYLETEILLSKEAYKSWREIQDLYENYKTSLGPWSKDDVIDYLNDEYNSLDPSAKTQIDNLANSPMSTMRLTFKARAT